MSGVVAGSATTSDQLNHRKPSIDSQSEDWDLLEIEGESSSTANPNSSYHYQQQLLRNNSNCCPTFDKMASGTEAKNHRNNNNNNNSNNNTNNNCEYLKSSKNEKYIEINPIGPAYKYPYALIFLCTVLYSLVTAASVLLTFTLVGLLFTRLYFITLLYFAFMFYDRNTCNRGGRRVDFVYRSRFWTYLAAYFPIKVRHPIEFKLNPSENYILNYHPHGIAAFGAVSAFATNGLNFTELFPAITIRLMVHETCFATPLMREVCATRGDCSVNSQSIDYILGDKSKSGKAGNLLAIVGGGLTEADLSDGETLKVVILERRGLVKKALMHGAHLIPCIAFGENSVYTKVNLSPSSLWRRFESRWYSLFKFKHPIYYGRSVISRHTTGLIPYDRRITLVMGEPIKVQRIESPSQQDIDQLHAFYICQLRAIYEANSDLCETYDKRMELL